MRASLTTVNNVIVQRSGRDRRGVKREKSKRRLVITKVEKQHVDLEYSLVGTVERQYSS